MEEAEDLARKKPLMLDKQQRDCWSSIHQEVMI